MRNKIGISVVIPNWNGRELLKRNLSPLIEAMDYYGGEYEIIVVDDGSVEGSPQFIRDTFPCIRVIRLEHNRGFPVAVNRGIEGAKHDMVFLLEVCDNLHINIITILSLFLHLCVKKRLVIAGIPSGQNQF